jgi:prepilin-type N-terminal cleavage/methylation domain-containing protein
MQTISRQLPAYAAWVRPLQSMATPMRAHRSGAGFTLVELMVVVTIIGLSVLAFAPSFSRAMAEREVSFATREILRIAKRARSESLGYRRAYMMVIDPGASDDQAPTVQLLRAGNNSCVAQNWAALQATCGTLNGQCVEDVDLNGNANFSTRGFTVRGLEEAVGGAVSSESRALCWAPNGLVYTRSPADLGTQLGETNANNTVNGGVVYKLSLFQDGSEVGRAHRVLIPLSGSPMVVP